MRNPRADLLKPRLDSPDAGPIPGKGRLPLPKRDSLLPNQDLLLTEPGFLLPIRDFLLPNRDILLANLALISGDPDVVFAL
jgi:hypothetical protein